MSTSKTKTATAQFEETLKTGTKAMQDSMDQLSKMGRESFEKAYPNFTQGYDEFASASKDTLDAVAKSAALMAKGFEQIATACTSMSQEAMENSVSATKSMMSCKNWKEVVDVQTDMTRTNMDRIMTEGTKIAEMSMKAANEASQPIQQRMNESVETFVKKSAA